MIQFKRSHSRALILSVCMCVMVVLGRPVFYAHTGSCMVIKCMVMVIFREQDLTYLLWPVKFSHRLWQPCPLLVSAG